MTLESPHHCPVCGQDASAEAYAAASMEQFAGYNPMSIQYADAWPEQRLADFVASYVCEACRNDIRPRY